MRKKSEYYKGGHAHIAHHTLDMEVNANVRNEFSEIVVR